MNDSCNKEWLYAQERTCYAREPIKKKDKTANKEGFYSPCLVVVNILVKLSIFIFKKIILISIVIVMKIKYIDPFILISLILLKKIKIK